jgi:2,3-bisphosphoglycerate-independent phosphoglycerate mutase
LPDHATPIEVQTHVADPVPFMLWGPGFSPMNRGRAQRFTEGAAEVTGVLIEEGYDIMGKLIG